MTNRDIGVSTLRWTGALIFLAVVMLSGCHSPKDSQIYFSRAAAEDPTLVQLHRTPLYTVFYDHVLSRCVLHSGHTWGETGGGGGGTGVGVAVFSCDPSRIRERLDMIEEALKAGRTLELPDKKPVRPARNTSGAHPPTPRPAPMGSPATPAAAPVEKPVTAAEPAPAAQPVLQ